MESPLDKCYDFPLLILHAQDCPARKGGPCAPEPAPDPTAQDLSAEEQAIVMEYLIMLAAAAHQGKLRPKRINRHVIELMSRLGITSDGPIPGSTLIALPMPPDVGEALKKRLGEGIVHAQQVKMRKGHKKDPFGGPPPDVD